MNCRHCKTVERDYDCFIVTLKDPECPNVRDNDLEAEKEFMKTRVGNCVVYGNPDRAITSSTVTIPKSTVTWMM